MFKRIEEGIEVLERELAEYRKKFIEIDTRERKDREESGKDYYGSIDWAREDFEWHKAKEAELRGMARALGLNEEEYEEIQKTAEVELSISVKEG